LGIANTSGESFSVSTKTGSIPIPDAHAVVVGEVYGQPLSDLFGAPRFGASPLVLRRMPSTLPCHSRPPDRSAVGRSDRASQSLLDIDAQSDIGHELRLLGTARRSIGVSLCRGRTVVEAATSGRSVTPQLARYGRRGATQTPGNLAYAVSLDAKKRNLLAFHQSKIPHGKRLCRRPRYCWWHAARLPKPSCPDSL